MIIKVVAAEEAKEHEYFRERPWVFMAPIEQTDSGFRVVVESVVRDLAAEHVGPRRATPGTGRAGAAIRATVS